jgi:ABC-type Mn2+/Zn2+ transport system permease subunit
MLLISAGLGLTGAATGVFASYQLDTPTGPTIVLSDVVILTFCLLASSVVAARRREAVREGRPGMIE